MAVKRRMLVLHDSALCPPSWLCRGAQRNVFNGYSSVAHVCVLVLALICEGLAARG